MTAAPESTAIPTRGEHHAAVGDLCARLFAEPPRLAEPIAHPVSGRFRIAPHRHADLLQLDVLDGAAGRVWTGAWVDVAGLSLLAHYPGDPHGYDLTGTRGARVCHLKLRVGRTWPAVRLRPWPRAAVGLAPMPRLVAAAFEVAEHPVPGGERPPLLTAALATALSLWPGAGVATVDPEGVDDPRDLAAAVRLVRRRLADPPGVGEMASAAHLSPRQFSRRFAARFGCTPMAFVHAHRLDRARTLLLGGRNRVSAVAELLGFSSHAAFTRWFARHAGVAPGAYRRSPESA